jgi:hypothetical protein
MIRHRPLQFIGKKQVDNAVCHDDADYDASIVSG